MISVPVGNFRIGEEEKNAVLSVLSSGRISEGPFTREFEKKWASYIGTSHCVLTNTGTSALIAGLTAVKYKNKLPEKTKVITTPLTYIATTNSLVLSGFEPVFVDVDETTMGITPENIKACIEESKENFSMVLPVHLMGYACNMDHINKIAKKHNLTVMEDSAQAHGTKIGTKRAGSLSALSIFSFHIAHNIQVGEMGCVNTSDTELAELVEKIKANGRRSEKLEDRFYHDLIGYNFKTVEFLPALGLVQLAKADEIIKQRQENVKFLNDSLSNFSDFIQLPFFSNKTSYLAYPVVLKNKKIQRDELIKKLASFGVESRPLFGCIPTQQPAYKKYKKKYSGKLPVADSLGANGLYIGCHQFLNDGQLTKMVNAFKKIFDDLQ